MKKTKLKVSELDLLAMVEAFREYKDMVQAVASTQPEFEGLVNKVKNIEGELLSLNKFIHRKYDGMNTEQYLAEVNHLIKTK